MLKNKVLFCILLISLLFFSACAKNDSVPMDQLAEDNKYHYRNQDLGFAINLPEEFIYYQTQRINTDNYSDIEIFVPTGDREYFQAIPGYANPLIIRVFDKDEWERSEEDEKNIYRKAGENKEKVYTVKLWDKIPSDWSKKWSQEMGEEIVSSFKIID